MTMTKRRYLAHLSWPEVAALDKRTGVVILPVGAIEQHGPHLPTITDSLLVTHVLDATLAALPDAVQAWALPALNYGKSNEHTGFPGTIKLSRKRCWPCCMTSRTVSTKRVSGGWPLSTATVATARCWKWPPATSAPPPG